MHPLFHVSLFKAVIRNHTFDATFPPGFSAGNYDFISAAVLQYMSIWQGDDRVHQILIGSDVLWMELHVVPVLCIICLEDKTFLEWRGN